eukprot:UC4_evm1s856
MFSSLLENDIVGLSSLRRFGLLATTIVAVAATVTSLAATTALTSWLFSDLETFKRQERSRKKSRKNIIRYDSSVSDIEQDRKPAIPVPISSDRQKESPNAVGKGGLCEAIGNTPLIELKSLSKLTGCTILGKCEFLNPGGSTKDRVALRIIEEAEAMGIIGKENSGRPMIFEGTAGSTGISLALLSAARGYGCNIIMPDDMSLEKVSALELLGAQVTRVPPVSIVNKEHYCRIAEKYAEEYHKEGHGEALFANQFENLANFRAHYSTTGPEIWHQTGHKVDAFVMSAGTGGTIAGVGSYLRERDPNIRVCLVDPPGSSLYHRIMHGVLYSPEQAEKTLKRNRYDTITEGIGIDRMTANFSAGLQRKAITEAFRGSDLEAVLMARFLLRHEGLFLGSSSAMNCVGAVKLARGMKPGCRIVTILCDGGQRYRGKLYNNTFLASKGLDVDVDYTPQDLGF